MSIRILPKEIRIFLFLGIKKHGLYLFIYSAFFLMISRIPDYNSFWIHRLSVYCLSSFLVNEFRSNTCSGAKNTLEQCFKISTFTACNGCVVIVYFIYTHLMLILNNFILRNTPYFQDISIQWKDIALSLGCLLAINSILNKFPVHKDGKQRLWPWLAGLILLVILPV